MKIKFKCSGGAKNDLFNRAQRAVPVDEKTENKFFRN
jgi:hypothetical protein